MGFTLDVIIWHLCTKWYTFSPLMDITFNVQKIVHCTGLKDFNMDHSVMARLLGQSISETARSVGSSWSAGGGGVGVLLGVPTQSGPEEQTGGVGCSRLINSQRH